MISLCKSASILVTTAALMVSIGPALTLPNKAFAADSTGSAAAAVQSDIVPMKSQAYDWGRVKIVGGGFIPGIIYNPKEKDLIYARTDMGGAYRWDPATKKWIQLLEWVSLEDWNLSGVESIATDPVDPNRVYIAAGTYSNDWVQSNGYILRSQDRGQTWEKTEMPFKFGGNMPGRSMGERLVVDPNDNRILYLGARNGNGLWKSEDYGATWHKVSSFTAVGDVKDDYGGNVGPVWVTFDPSTGSAGHATQTIYVGLADTQTSIYKSVDGGATWEPVAGQPKQGFLPHHGTLGSNGMLYVSFNSTIGPYLGGNGAVWKLDTKTGEWTDISPEGAGNTSNPYGGLAVDAQHPDTLMVATMNKWWPEESIYRSTDGGKTWNSLWQFSSYPKRDNRYTIDYSISPWLDWGVQRDPETDPETSPKLGWMIGDLEIDPFNSDRIMYGTGATLFGSENVTNLDKGEKIGISVMADGIEETAILGLISPSSGAPLISAMGDIGGFRHEDLNTAPRMIRNPYIGTSTDLDYAETNSNLIVRVGHASNQDARMGISTDNGVTWTPATNAWQAENGDNTSGGWVAVGANGHTIVWAPHPDGSAVRPVSFSTDLGKTWTASKGIPQGASVSSDRVNPDKFYGFLDGKFYVSTDGGANFTASAASGLPNNLNGKFKAAPTAEGDIWLASEEGLFRSTDSGASFGKIGGVDEAVSVGFGKEAPGQTYKTIYAGMRVNGGKFGFYRSEDEGASWIRINDEQHQFANARGTITGDGQVYGRVYIGTNGMGIVRGDIKEGATVQTPMQSYVNAMQPGYNLGNSLDARGPDETSWGNPVVTQAFIEQIAAQGFKSIRIPVTWYQHTGPAPSYTVDPAWMSRVQQIVDWSLEAGLHVMINMHHDSVEWVNTMDTNHDQVVAEYTAVWKQIANTFKDYPNKLVFESINEPVFGNNLADTTQMSLLDELNTTFFNIVRESGGNNGVRPLVLPSLWTNASQKYVDSLAATIEQLNDPNLITTVHFYGLWHFSVNIAGYTTFNAEVKNDIDTTVNNVYNTFVSKGIPVVIGEYGILGYGKGEETVERGEMLKYFEYFLHAMQSKSIATMMWDYGPYVNRTTFEWSDPELYHIIMHSLTGRTSTTSFDRIFIKSGETVSDQSVTLNLNGNSFVSLKNGDQTLVPGTDYTVDGDVLTLKASYLSSLATGALGQKAVLSAHFSAGPAWKLYVNYYDTATLSSVSGTITSQGFDIPTAFNGDRVATMEAKYADGGNAGPHNWTSYKEIYDSYNPDYANGRIRLTPNFFQNTNDGVVNLTFHFWSGKVVTYTMTKNGTTVTGTGAGNSAPSVSITSYEDGQAINLNNLQLNWTFHDADDADVQSAYQVQASSNGWETVDVDSGELAGASGSYTLNGLADGNWSIRVRLKDNGGTWSEWAYRSLVIDTAAPTLKVVLDKETLWPANNKLVKVTATIETDNELSQVELLSITPSAAVDSYESMVQEAEFSTFDTEFLLLAKKSKGKGPLVYSITYRATDQAGNVTEASSTVTVPHDQSGERIS
ncbi:cellulase family glycosylhydrolase [Paenibacillus mucilaginosus]|nr:cellulase family glycosylhydrolase [Paenibacillus mucilaginosus]MCG7216846.1 cellulase family glycosylhydrolase [Paenibacillus mucilaginosus]